MLKVKKNSKRQTELLHRHLKQDNKFVQLISSSSLSSMREDWSSLVVNREALVFLCINYAFFSVVVITFVLFMIVLTHTSSTDDDLLMSVAIMATSFLLLDMIVAKFLVQAIRMNTEVKLLV